MLNLFCITPKTLQYKKRDSNGDIIEIQAITDTYCKIQQKKQYFKSFSFAC